ncbi:hypothetical protein BH23VER1_BH23VER1_04030 [soil metagenome]
MKNVGNVTVGVDFSDASVAALREAARIAAWGDATLHITHTVSEREIEDRQKFRTIPLDDLLAKVREQLRSFAMGALDTHPAVEFHLSLGQVFPDVLRVVGETGSGLLVMGAYGMGGVPDRTGMVATKCVRKAPVPVLLVRKEHTEPFRRVVACTDFSETAKRASTMAAQIALQDGADFHLLHVHCPPWLNQGFMVYDFVPEIWDAGYQSEYRSGLESQLEGAVESLRSEYPGLSVVSKLLEHSHDAYGIVGYIRERGADLVVLGTRGRTGLKKLLLGTTAERIVSESPCSVLAVKPEGFTYEVG